MAPAARVVDVRAREAGDPAPVAARDLAVLEDRAAGSRGLGTIAAA